MMHRQPGFQHRVSRVSSPNYTRSGASAGRMSIRCPPRAVTGGIRLDHSSNTASQPDGTRVAGATCRTIYEEPELGQGTGGLLLPRRLKAPARPVHTWMSSECRSWSRALPGTQDRETNIATRRTAGASRRIHLFGGGLPRAKALAASWTEIMPFGCTILSNLCSA